MPDGDTGTNLYLTIDAALDDLRAQHDAIGGPPLASVAQECADLERAMMISARGNSGVLISQFVRGFADVFRERVATFADVEAIAEGLARGAILARASVERPVEGTILSVADATAAAAARVRDRGGSLADLTEAAVTAAKTALAATPGQLPALAAAGVVDSGGAGYLLLVEALDRIVRDVVPTSAYAVDGFFVAGAAPAAPAAGHEPEGPGYEVMYLLSDSDDARVSALRATLNGLGDSLLVIGGPDLWNVHVHVDDVGAAIEAGIEAGVPRRIRVTHFAEQMQAKRPASDQAVVACVAGPGIEAIFAASGATTVASGPGRRASAGQLLQAITASHALNVLLLPNDRDTMLAAQAAASAAGRNGLRVHVITSRTAVQGLAALAVFDEHASAEANVVAMTSASSATRTGALTVASKEGLTSGGPCHPGDILGVVGGDIAIVGDHRDTVAAEVVRRLAQGGGELLTVLRGAEVPDGVADRLVDVLARDFPLLDVQVLDGGQPHYELLIGLE